MALTVTGVDANGRITPKGVNVVIPPEGAGIGDLVYKQTSVFANPAYNTPAYFKVIGRGTANASVLTINGTSYTVYGGIYGFVAGMAMVIAPAEKGGLVWLTSGSSSVGPTHSKSPLMRNGKSHTYAQMNTAQNAGYITKSDTAQPSNGLLASAYEATPLTESTYLSTANTETLKRFGSWKEYIRQTLRVNGVPGTPFGMTTTGVKVHEFGRWMTHQLEATHGSTAAAAHACYIHNEGGGTWWLPSMFELAELMIDDHLNKVNENPSGVFAAVDRGSYRWSCVRYSADLAWIYYGISGMPNNAGFTNTMPVRPVTLLKLVS